MLDISSPRVLIPTTLYVLLQQCPRDLQIPLFIISYFIIANINGLILTKADYIVASILMASINQLSKSIAFNALIYAFVFALLRMNFPSYY